MVGKCVAGRVSPSRQGAPFGQVFPSGQGAPFCQVSPSRLGAPFLKMQVQRLPPVGTALSFPLVVAPVFRSSARQLYRIPQVWVLLIFSGAQLSVGVFCPYFYLQC